MLRKAFSTITMFAVGLLATLTLTAAPAKADDQNLPYTFEGYVNKLLPPSVARGSLIWDQVSETILDILPDNTVSQFTKEGQFIKSWGTPSNGLTPTQTLFAAMLPNGNLVTSNGETVTVTSPDGDSLVNTPFLSWCGGWRFLQGIKTTSTGRIISYDQCQGGFAVLAPSDDSQKSFFLQYYYLQNITINSSRYSIQRLAATKDGRFVASFTGGPLMLNFKSTSGSYISADVNPFLGTPDVISMSSTDDAPTIWAREGANAVKYSLLTGKAIERYTTPSLSDDYENFIPLGRPDYGYVTKKETGQYYLVDFGTNTYSPLGDAIDSSAGQITSENIWYQNSAIGPNDEIAIIDPDGRVTIYSKDRSVLATFSSGVAKRAGYNIDFLPDGDLVVGNKESNDYHAYVFDAQNNYASGNALYQYPWRDHRFIAGKSQDELLLNGYGRVIGRNSNRDFLTSPRGCTICNIAFWDSSWMNNWSPGAYTGSINLSMGGGATVYGISQSPNGDIAVLVSGNQGPQIKVFSNEGDYKGSIFERDVFGESALSSNLDYYSQNAVMFFDSSGNLYVKTVLGIAKFSHLREFTNKPVPRIVGKGIVGNDLEVIPGDWDAGASLSYQWLAGGQPIAGATSAILHLDGSLVDKMIRVKVTASLDGYVNTSQVSEQAVIVDLGRQTLKPKPIIRGDFEVGNTIVADPGIWDDGVTLWYTWFRNGYYVSGSYNPTYTLQQDDVGQNISVIVYSTKWGYYAEQQASAAVNFVAKKFDSTIKPIVTGATAIGHALTVTKGNWPQGTYFSYQWKLDGNNIPWQNGDSYVVRESDLNHLVSVQMTATKIGYETVVVDSDPLTISWGIFTGTNSPAVSGTPKVGQTLGVSQGTVDPYAQVSYQWLRNGSYIWGETGSTYQVRTWDYGNNISVITTWSSTGYQTSTATSPAVSIGLGDIVQTGKPQFTGDATIGSTIYVSPGSWSNASLSYRWFKDGVLIPNATNSYLSLTKADFGRSFKVQVTGSSQNYSDLTVESDSIQVGLNKSSRYVDLSGLDLSNLNLTDFDLSYANLSSAKFNGSTLTNVSMSGANVSGASFKDATLTGVYSGGLSGTPTQIPSGWKFSNGYLIGAGANLSGAYLYSLTLDHLDLTGTNFSNANLNYANLSFSNLNGANLTGTYLSGASLGGVRTGNILGIPNNLPSGWSIYSGYLIGPGTDLSGVNLSGQSMVGLNLRSANLVGTNFSNTDLSNADLTGASLLGANLSNAKLISTIFVAADLTNAIIRNARLNSANMQTAILSGADLSGANLSLANLNTALLDGVLGENIIGPAVNYPEGWQISGGKLLKTQALKGAATILTTAQVGQVLTPTTSNWDEGVTLEYRWLVDGVAIPNATARSYTVTAADAGRSISVVITATKPGFAAQSVTSGAVKVSSDGGIQVLGNLPTIVGNPSVGSLLSAEMEIPNNSIATYQWYRDGRNISNSSAKIYVPSSQDLAKKITVSVSITKSGSAVSNSFSSAVTIAAGIMQNSNATLSGVFVVGQKVGVDIANLNGAKVAYQWLRDGLPISRENKSTYLLKAQDADRVISLKLTLSKVGFITATQDIDGILVAKTNFQMIGTPVVTRILQAGKTLMVDPGKWDAGTKFTYTWLRGGIVMGTSKLYKLAIADAGSQIQVRVEANKPGVNSITVYTASVIVG